MNVKFLFTFILSICSIGVYAQEFDDLYFFEEDQITENNTPVEKPNALEKPQFNKQSDFSPAVSTAQFDQQMEQRMQEEYINTALLAQLTQDSQDSSSTISSYQGSTHNGYTVVRRNGSGLTGINSPFSPYNRTWGWFYDGFSMTGHDMWGRTIEYDPWSQQIYVYDPMNHGVVEVYSAWSVGMGMRARGFYSPYGFYGGFGYNPYMWGGAGWGYGYPYGNPFYGNPYMWAGNPYYYPYGRPPYGGYHRPIRPERPHPKVIATRRQSNLSNTKYPAKVRSELYNRNTSNTPTSAQQREYNNRRMGQNNMNNSFDHNRSNYRSSSYSSPSPSRSSSSSMPSRRRR